jgi:hypothetical protein
MQRRFRFIAEVLLLAAQVDSDADGFAQGLRCGDAVRVFVIFLPHSPIRMSAARRLIDASGINNNNSAWLAENGS